MPRPLLFALLCLSPQLAAADFSDDLPPTALQPEVEATPMAPQAKTPTAAQNGGEKETKKPAPTVVQPSEKSALPAPTPSAEATPRAPKTNTIPAPLPGPVSQGDFLSGNFFSDVKHDTKAPVNLENSDRLSGSREKGLLTLSGNVIVTQSDLRMNSNMIDMYIDSATNKPAKILAHGKVLVQKPVAPGATEFIEARAAEMEYSMQTGKMILRKQARITRGKQCNIQGEILTYDLTTGSVGGKNVRGTCLPPPSVEKKP